MISIKTTPFRNIDLLADNFYDAVRISILTKIYSIKGKKWLKDFLENNLYKIVAGMPSELILINKYYKQQCKNNGFELKLIDNITKKIFDYDWLAGNKKRSYEFANALQVNSCPYCNRNYTVTVIETKRKHLIVRPDFDHFLLKSKYPLLALSFYNLIPSCPLCNRSIKGFHEVAYGKYLHPYEDSYGSALRINYFPRDTDSMIGIKQNLEIRILLDSKNLAKAKRCKRNFDLFKLKEIYQTSHLDEISEIIRKYHISGGSYLEILQKQFKDLGTLEELYKIAFSNYYSEDDFGSKPLGKLTKDIVEQLSFVIPRI
jgi:hypothetical protein